MVARNYTPETADVVANSIPPEGDEYNARRQEELHAAVLNKAQLTRRMAEMIRDGAPADQIGLVIDTIAQIDREIPHISKDLAVSVQGRNLSIFLERMDISLVENTRAIERSVEAATLRALSDVAISLDQITGLVQQGIATGVKALAIAEKGVAIGEKALVIGKKAQTTGISALAVGREALAIARAGEARMAQVEEAVGALTIGITEIEHQLTALRGGQVAYNQRLDELDKRHGTQIDAINGRLDRKRERLDVLEEQVHEMRGPELSPEKRADYIATLMRMIEWWKKTYPDDVT
jgi:hypothetical protein